MYEDMFNYSNNSKHHSLFCKNRAMVNKIFDFLGISKYFCPRNYSFLRKGFYNEGWRDRAL